MNTIIFKKIKKFLQMKRHQDFDHNDVFLVEFPKSGITWLSFLIANSLLKNHDENVTFYNYHKYIADIHQLRGAKISNRIYPLNGYRFIKSHHEQTPSYYFVVYILRNPFDVMISYYRFMQSSGYRDSFENFVISKRYGIQNWVDHVKGWLVDNNDLAQRIHVIRYEDLMADATQELSSLFANLGLRIDKPRIQKALADSSKENMKKSEELYKNFNPVYKKSNMDFVRKCKVKQEDCIMSDNIIHTIQKESNHIIKLFYQDMTFYD